MKFACRDHQRKGTPYISALQNAGYKLTKRVDRADFLLIDMDTDSKGDRWNAKIREADKCGMPVFIYPHSARPMVQWDGMYKPYPCKCNFVIANGHAEVMRRFGYPYKIKVSGWALCEQKKFSGGGWIENVLFAPIHPNVYGYIAKEDKQANIRAFEILRKLPVNLIVRHIGHIEHSGLWQSAGVTYINAMPDTTYRDIDRADLVIGTQTFLWLAVARGKPAVSFGEEIRPHSALMKDKPTRWADNWEAYRDYMAYPYDLLKADTPMELFEYASRNEAGDWRNEFIGMQFDGKEFVKTLESYL
jgi:hypothetical protein